MSAQGIHSELDSKFDFHPDVCLFMAKSRSKTRLLDTTFASCLFHPGRGDRFGAQVDPPYCEPGWGCTWVLCWNLKPRVGEHASRGAGGIDHHVYSLPGWAIVRENPGQKEELF